MTWYDIDRMRTTGDVGRRGQRHRVWWSVLLLFLAGLLLAACVVPEAALRQGEVLPTRDLGGTFTEAERAAKVEAIQTRVEELRAEQSTAKGIGPTPEQQALLVKLQPRGEAPELFNEVWLNSAPLQLADLRGKVVLVEFWTYG